MRNGVSANTFMESRNCHCVTKRINECLSNSKLMNWFENYSQCIVYRIVYSLHYCTITCGNHRIRMEIEAKANNRQNFWGKMAAPWYCVADELIRAGRASVTLKRALFKTVVLRPVAGSSVVASWTSTLKNAGSNLLEIFIFSHWYFFHFSVLNPLNNSTEQ